MLGRLFIIFSNFIKSNENEGIYVCIHFFVFCDIFFLHFTFERLETAQIIVELVKSGL